MIALHGFSPLGNCHKVTPLLGQLGHACCWIETGTDPST